MSADNGIYILETRGPEWRVAELQAVENINYDTKKGDSTEDPDVMIENAREMWADARVWLTRDEAWTFAQNLHKNFYTEYGINTITVDRYFDPPNGLTRVLDEI